MDKTIHLIGNAHLDPIWLWRWQVGCGEVLQTFRSALDRLKEYEDFVFTCSSASYYRWVEEIDPDMFAEIQARVAEGRWVPVNGWWVQPDCNMPSGESFARHALYSQLYYLEKFGQICKTGYNVDSFGHNGMLPQLIRNGGMNSYVMMRPSSEENPEIPGNLFWWESPDGSRVLTYRIPDSYAHTGTSSLEGALETLGEISEEKNHGCMLFYGVGNHGGGPTKGDIEYLQKVEGFSPLEFSSPDDYFTEMLSSSVDFPVWRDDMQHHASGCYSATSLVKQFNRRAENLLASAEVFDTIASKLTESKPSTFKFSEAWKDVCFNQFHDILCGCSIMEAYEDVKSSTGRALTLGDRALNTALLKIGKNINTYIEGISDSIEIAERHLCNNDNFPRPVVVYNPHSFAIKVPVRTYYPSRRVTDSDGNEVVFQNVRSSRSNDSHLDTVFIAEVPSMGYAVYWLNTLRVYDCMKLDNLNVETYASSVKATEFTMENEYIKVSFDEKTGGISSLINKENGFDYASAGTLAIPTVIDDSVADTWAHNIFTFHDIKGTMNFESIKLVESGPARAVIRVKHSFGRSTLSQDFILAEGQKILRSKCKAIWQEDFTMLKMPFKLDGDDEISTYEIPCGYIKRPCNGEEEPAQMWADLTLTCANGTRKGLSVITDSKYSYDCPGKELRLTCLRNVIFADHYSSRPEADFNFTDEGVQRFEYAIYLHDGEVENSDVVKQSAVFNKRPIAVPEGYHKGELPQRNSFLQLDAPNVIATAFKFSEDGSGAVILRCYETAGKDETRANIRCDMFDANFKVDIYHNEIKTFRIAPDGRVSDVNFLEGIV